MPALDFRRRYSHCMQKWYERVYLENMPNLVFIWETSSLRLLAMIELKTKVSMFKWSKTVKNRLCIIGGTERLVFWEDNDIIETEFHF